MLALTSMPSPSPNRAASFPCAACGGETSYDPGSSGLKCDHCGSVTPCDSLPAEATEHAIEEALDNVAPQGWGTGRITLRCSACGAESAIDPHLEATSCPFCGSPHVMKQEDAPSVVRPETLIPFRVPREAALESFRGWMQSLWFRPGALKRSWQLGRISGVYLPFWTFDAATYSVWTAEAGHYYWERSGNQQVRRVRWERAAGELSRFYDDELICASQGLASRLVDGVAPFSTGRALVPYRPEYLAGWTAERYAVGLKEAWAEAERRIVAKARSACAERVPGDTHRNLDVRTRLSNVTFKHVLLPIWSASYLYRGKCFYFLVNGENGKVHGEAPYSWPKMVAAAVGALFGLFVLHWLGILDR